MRSIKGLGFALALLVNLSAQTFESHYYYQDQRINLLAKRDQAAVYFNPGADKEKILNILQNTMDSHFSDANILLGSLSRIVRLTNKLEEQDLYTLINNLRSHPQVVLASPVFHLSGSKVRQAVSAEFLVKFKEEVNLSQIEVLNSANNVRIIRSLSDYTFLLAANPLEVMDGLQAANIYHESGLTEWAQPNFIYMDWELINSEVNDTYWPQQWAHKNTGQSVASGAGDGYPAQVNAYPDADMDVDLAWDLLNQNGGAPGGSSEIIVGLLDSGADLDHPDIQANLFSSGRDFTLDGQSDANDTFGHGTLTAGIIAATANNGLGVAGIAYNSQLLPARVMNDWGVTTSENLAAAFDYLVNQGADVINNSWGGTSPDNAITEAIQRAKTHGRDGKGCVVFFSSGNEGHDPVNYPASLTEVIAIGASNMFDEKKHTGSQDLFRKLGGNYGPELDLVAPTSVYSTDIQGSAGYADGDYLDNFNGTSAACPNAAGVAALILAADYNLTADEVQNIMQQTADKIDLYTYDDNGWNKHTGYGRVNAYNALKMIYSSDGSAPLVQHNYLPPHSSIEEQVIQVEISDNSGVAVGTEAPQLFYRAIFENDTSAWSALSDGDGPAGNTYAFTIPGQKWNTMVQYYIYVQDNSSESNGQTYPSSGTGATPPSKFFHYHVGNFTNVSYTSTNVPVSWNGSEKFIISTLDIPDQRQIVDLNATIAVSSGDIPDINITLEAPDQIGVGLAGQYDGDAYTNTTFDDEAGTHISNGTAPYSGSFRADNSLVNLDGKNAAGAWKLMAYDDWYLGSNSGTINNWSVDITYMLPNAYPVITDVPGQTTNEGGSFNPIQLDLYVSDADHADDELTWTYSGNSELSVSIDANRMATVSIPDNNWFGSEIITFSVMDPGGYTDSDTALFVVNNINDAPVITDIPGESIAEGQSFTTIQLDNFVEDIDNPDSLINWQASGNTDLDIIIDENRIATILTPDENWFGSEVITFIATDPGGLSDSNTAHFTVNAVNDTPVVADIPGQSVAEGGQFTSIDLDNYVTDVDNSVQEMDWTYEGNSELIITIDDTSHIAQITIPNSEWIGSEIITFIATDPAGLSDSDTAGFTVTAVNDTPVVSNIPGQTINEGDNFVQIFLDDYVSDADNTDEEMNWAATNTGRLLVEINELRVATISTPDSNWNGSETITFTATDPGGLSDSDAAVFNVSAVNDTPRITSIPATGATQDVLYQYQVVADDPDSGAVLTYALPTAPGFLNINSQTGLISGTPSNDDVGMHNVLVRVEDEHAAADSQSYVLTVLDENDPPVVDDIPDQSIAEGETFVSIPLDEYVGDPDHNDNEISWQSSGNSELTVTIDTSRMAMIEIPDPEWNGSETIIFTATDPGGLSDSDAAQFMVSTFNDAPLVSDIPDQTINEGQSFNIINLDDYVTDADNSDEEITWTYSGNSELLVSINENRRASVQMPSVDWYGEETIRFKAKDPDGKEDSDSALFKVLPVDDPPRFTAALPEISFKEDDSLVYAISNWYPYVEDTDDVDSVLNYNVTDADDNIWAEARLQAYFFNSAANWFGSDTLRLVVSDQFYPDTSDLVVHVSPVNDAPQIINLPDSLVFLGMDSSGLDMIKYEDDVDSAPENLFWTFGVSDTALKYNYETDSKLLTVWAGNEELYAYLYMMLTDDSSAAARDTLSIHVKKDPTAISYFTTTIPDRYILNQNYPNPFNPQTQIRFGLPAPGHVRVEIFNLRGQRIKTLLDGRKTAGYHEVIFDGTNLGSGVYFYRLEAKNYSAVKRMLLIK